MNKLDYMQFAADCARELATIPAEAEPVNDSISMPLSGFDQLLKAAVEQTPAEAEYLRLIRELYAKFGEQLECFQNLEKQSAEQLTELARAYEEIEQLKNENRLRRAECARLERSHRTLTIQLADTEAELEDYKFSATNPPFDHEYN